MTMDATTVAQAAPPGSMRQLAVLFSPAEKRTVLEALYVVEHEVFASARNPSHDVAHTRLQWWRTEVDRLVHGAAQHPATRELQPLRDLPEVDLGILHEMLVAADLDLARITYDHDTELAAYARRAGGVIQIVAARWIAAPQIPSPAALEAASRLGAIVREAEAIRDLRQDVHDGRVYIPLQRLESARLELEQLRGGDRPEALRAVLQAWHERLQSEMAAAAARLDSEERPWLRHVIVLVRLHARLLTRLSARGYDVSERVELGPLERVWIAWRAARSTV